jgi:malonate decarboxylase gamma subunit
MRMMTLDNVLNALFPAGHQIQHGPSGTVHGTASVGGFGDVTVIGIVGGTPLGVDGAIVLAGHVLAAIAASSGAPIVVLIDTATQNMARRDELLGLNEYLAHLIKSLTLATAHGHRTVSVIFGQAAAGAFIATGLSTQVLVAVPGAQPSVMDLRSISRITQLPLDELKTLATSTPVFAPGVEPLFAIGAVTEWWMEARLFAVQLAALLGQSAVAQDCRDQLGLERNGRLVAHKTAERVIRQAAAHA